MEIEVESIEQNNKSMKESKPLIVLQDEKKSVLGLMYGIISSLSYSAQSPILKLLFNYSDTITAYEVLYWQGISMVIMNYLFVKYHGEHVLNVKPMYRNVLLFRGLVGFTGI